MNDSILLNINKEDYNKYILPLPLHTNNTITRLNKYIKDKTKEENTHIFNKNFYDSQFYNLLNINKDIIKNSNSDTTSNIDTNYFATYRKSNKILILDHNIMGLHKFNLLCGLIFGILLSRQIGTFLISEGIINSNSNRIRLFIKLNFMFFFVNLGLFYYFNFYELEYMKSKYKFIDSLLYGKKTNENKCDRSSSGSNRL